MLDSRAERSALGAAPDILWSINSRCWLHFSIYKNLTAESHEQTSKWTEYHLLIWFRTWSLFRFAQTRLVLATRPKSEARNRIRKIIMFSLRNAYYLSFFKFKETPFLLSIFFQLVDNPKGTFWTAYKRCVRHGTYRGIPPVSTAGITGTGRFGNFGTSIPVPDTSVSSVRYQYRYRTLR